MPHKFSAVRVKTSDHGSTLRVNPGWRKAADLASAMKDVKPAGMPPEVPGLDYHKKPKAHLEMRQNPLAVRMMRGK